MELLKEFKPALMFLGKFVMLYFVGNIIYGIYIASFGVEPDPVTRGVSLQTAWILKLSGYDAVAEDVQNLAKVALKERGGVVINVFEGCNGLNIMVVFIAFLFAFGGQLRQMTFFLLAGLFVIHVFNLVRLSLLYHLAITSPSQFYYFHKYLFTAVLYIVVFALWALWVIRFNGKQNIRKAAT